MKPPGNKKNEETKHASMTCGTTQRTTIVKCIEVEINARFSLLQCYGYIYVCFHLTPAIFYMLLPLLILMSLVKTMQA